MPERQPRGRAEKAQEIARIARSLAAHAEWLAEAGTLGVAPAAASELPAVGAWPEEQSPRTARSAGPAAPPVEREREGSAAPESGLGSRAAPEPAPPARATAEQRLTAVRAELGECRRCRLAKGRRHLVFGAGDPRARLAFVGEGPGRDEDRLGEPFVGRAGQLLTDIIEKGMRLRRRDVYICNVVKCRPPQNRDPEPDEIATCRPYLLRQLDAIGPEVVVALGRVAAQALLGSAEPIGRLRGRWSEVAGIPVMPTLHPAYLLRNPEDKRLVWEDVKQVMRRLGIEP